MAIFILDKNILDKLVLDKMILDEMLFSRPKEVKLCHMFNFSTINYYWVFIPITTYNHDLSFADIQSKTKGLAFGFHSKQ